MKTSIIKIYRRLFAKKIFYRFNKLLHSCSLSGLGILNYESELISGENYFLNLYLRKFNNPVVVDVGANIGNYSKLVLAINKRAKIFAFEPHPKSFSRLSLALNEVNVVLINSAVGSNVGTLDLYDYEEADGSEHASLYRGVIEGLRKSKVVEHQVPVVTLDNYFTLNKVEKIDLLKIDTEGHEYQVLKGAVELIRQSKIGAIHFEFNEMNVESRVFFQDFVKALPNYQFFRLLPKGMIDLKPNDALFNEIFAYQNIIAIKK